MTTPSVAPIKDDATRIARLERRIKRERAARMEAEAIADRQMRELWVTNRELDKRVAERTAELQEAMAALETSTTGGARFVSNMSHEMLTPLNGIVGMLELLGEHSHTDAMRSYVASANEATDRLHRLIRRLLDLVQLAGRSLKPNVAETAIADLASSLEERWRVPCLSKGQLITVTSRGSNRERVWLDQQRLLQVLNEMMDNVTRHATPGVVTIEFDDGEPMSDTSDPMLRVVLTDSGPGFDPPPVGRFEETFMKIDTSPGRKTDGAGIGIALARELTRVLGGQLRIDSEPGSPTRIEITIACGPNDPDAGHSS